MRKVIKEFTTYDGHKLTITCDEKGNMALYEANDDKGVRGAVTLVNRAPKSGCAGSPSYRVENIDVNIAQHFNSYSVIEELVSTARKERGALYFDASDAEKKMDSRGNKIAAYLKEKNIL